MELEQELNDKFNDLVDCCMVAGAIDLNLYMEYDVKRGLRDASGKGVLTGLTEISDVIGYKTKDGKKVPCEGKLWYRGYNVYDLICGLRGKRYAFEGAAYLLLLGDLPNAEQLNSFNSCLFVLSLISRRIVSPH